MGGAVKVNLLGCSLEVGGCGGGQDDLSFALRSSEQYLPVGISGERGEMSAIGG